MPEGGPEKIKTNGATCSLYVLSLGAGMISVYLLVFATCMHGESPTESVLHTWFDRLFT